MANAQQFVGNYRMFHLIRAGAVYEIWAVRPMADRTAYAMKWLPPGERYSRAAINELRHEYSVGSGFDHPCVIKTYECENTGSSGAYLLLELYKVPNLKQEIIARYKDLHHLAKKVLTDAASGLQYLHSQGWIHRDVKPDNFLIGPDGHVKLIDFNLSRRRVGALGKIFGGKTTVQGTYSYMSPEQIRGVKPEPPADIYSFGCVVYEFFHGKPPFTANSPAELLQRHLKSKPPLLSTNNKNITPEFSSLVARMMAKDPKERPETMKDAEMEIKAAKIFHQTPQPPAETPEETATEKP